METTEKSESGLTRFAFRPILHEPLETPSWEEFLSDRDRLELLIFSGKEEYEPLIEHLSTDCKQLARYDPAIYLIDFDVLRNYIEMRTVDGLDTVAVDFVFKGSRQPYALPLGAYRELSDWLSRMFHLTREVIESHGDLSRVKFAEQLAEVLGIPKDDVRRLTEQQPPVLGSLMSWGTIAVNRLANLLSDARFYGVVSDYDSSDACKLEEMLKARPRGKDEPRTKKDERDGINLAIAFKAARKSRSEAKQQGGKAPGYILITQTAAVLTLSKSAARNWDSASGAELCALLQIPGQSVPPRFFPVIDPKRIMCAERIGVYENPDQAGLIAQDLRNNFRTVTEYLDTILFQQEVGLCLMTHPLVVKLEEEHARMAFRAIWGSLSFSPAQRLEEARATTVSVESARQKQQGVDVQTTDLLRQKSAALLRILGEAVRALRSSERVSYRCSTPRVLSDGSASRIEISARKLGGTVSLMSGAHLKPESGSGSPGEYYYLRWPIACSEADFLTALQEFLPPTSKLVPAPGPLTMITAAKAMAFAYEGFVLYTSYAVFGGSLDVVCAQNSPDILQLNSLGRVMDTYFHGRPAPEIQQYRVNTALGDFCLDIVPPEGDNRRFLTVISNYDLSEYIVLLQRKTGAYLITDPPALVAVLKRSLSRFAPPPTTAKKD
jgi:hypothetical protein